MITRSQLLLLIILLSMMKCINEEYVNLFGLLEKSNIVSFETVNKQDIINLIFLYYIRIYCNNKCFCTKCPRKPLFLLSNIFAKDVVLSKEIGIFENIFKFISVEVTKQICTNQENDINLLLKKHFNTTYCDKVIEEVFNEIYKAKSSL